MWIGLIETQPPGTWVWDGCNIPMVYSNWGNNEPSGNEFCVSTVRFSINHPNVGKWADISCSRVYKGMCECIE